MKKKIIWIKFMRLKRGLIKSKIIFDTIFILKKNLRYLFRIIFILFSFVLFQLKLLFFVKRNTSLNRRNCRILLTIFFKIILWIFLITQEKILIRKWINSLKEFLIFKLLGIWWIHRFYDLLKYISFLVKLL